MDDATPEPLTGAAPNLAAALRRARVENAELSDAVAHVRDTEIARLEILHDSLRPVLKQVPKDIDFFDVGILPAEHPRLFVDMIAFVELGRDQRTYRFMQDTRHGRIVIAQSERIDRMVDAVAAYIARRLVERERAFAADEAFPSRPPGRTAETWAPIDGKSASPPRKRRFGRLFLTALVHAIEFLGVAALVIVLIAGLFHIAGLLRPLFAGGDQGLP